MNEQTTEEPSTTRRLTDIALLIIAIAAIGSWVWRRLRNPAPVDSGSAPVESQVPDDKMSGGVEFPPNNAPV